MNAKSCQESISINILREEKLKIKKRYMTFIKETFLTINFLLKSLEGQQEEQREYNKKERKTKW